MGKIDPTPTRGKRHEAQPITRYVSQATVAAAYGLSAGQYLRLVRDHSIPARRVGTSVLVSVADLEAALDRIAPVQGSEAPTSAPGAVDLDALRRSAGYTKRGAA